MNIRDLSIGDWVTYDRDTTPVQIMSVYTRSGQQCVAMTDSYYSDGVIGFLDNVNPIPLTPEILEKNGWSKKYDDVWEYGVWRISQINKCLFILYNEKYDYDFCVYIDTVHQMQHAFRLAGIEKEIKM